MNKLWSEWFWSEKSARSAARRVESKGYLTNVRYAMDAHGRHDWQIDVFAPSVEVTA